MNSRKESLIILYVLALLLVPLIWVTWSSASKILNIILFREADYVIRQATLTDNSCKKYDSRATFLINYNRTSVEGRDGCLLWAAKGDLVKVYFNKHDLYDNGSFSRLINLFIGRFILLLLLAFYFLKRLTHYRQLNITASYG